MSNSYRLRTVSNPEDHVYNYIDVPLANSTIPAQQDSQNEPLRHAPQYEALDNSRSGTAENNRSDPKNTFGEYEVAIN